MLAFVPKPAFVTVSLCSFFLGTWIVATGSKSPPIDQRVSRVALSRSGRWLGIGTAHGRITVWDQIRNDAPKQFAFPHGDLNDLQFSQDEQLLAIASEDLGIYTLTESTAPRLLRSDDENYGSARFSPD